jgi:hypothetical protein
MPDKCPDCIELLNALKIARRWMIDEPYWPANKAEVALVDSLLAKHQRFDGVGL